MMYSCEQPDGGHAFNGTGPYQPPCVAGRSSPLHQLSARQPAGHQQQLLSAAAAAVGSTATAQQQPAARRASSKKKHAAAASRRSATTVVATDVANFRAMVQELTGFPPASIFRPLPRRVHAANPFVAEAASEATNNTDAAGNSSSLYAPVAQPAMPQQQCASPAGLFDGLANLGSPEFDSWADLSID